MRRMMCKDPIQKGYSEVKWRYVTAGGSISVDVFLFSASFAVIFMPCGLNVPIHLRANGTFTAEIAGHCASHLFISSKRAEMACGLSGVGGGGGNHRTMRSVAAVFTCAWPKRLEMEPDDVCFQ